VASPPGLSWPVISALVCVAAQSRPVCRSSGDERQPTTEALYGTVNPGGRLGGVNTERPLRHALSAAHSTYLRFFFTGPYFLRACPSLGPAFHTLPALSFLQPFSAFASFSWTETGPRSVLGRGESSGRRAGMDTGSETPATSRPASATGHRLPPHSPPLATRSPYLRFFFTGPYFFRACRSHPARLLFLSLRQPFSAFASFWAWVGGFGCAVLCASAGNAIAGIDSSARVGGCTIGEAKLSVVNVPSAPQLVPSSFVAHSR
jgi:hypothetical protein